MLTEPYCDAGDDDLAVVKLADGRYASKRLRFRKEEYVELLSVNSVRAVELIRRREMARAWRVWGAKFRRRARQ